MLTIGNIYISREEGQSRLCADIALNGKGTTLWFSVPTEQEAYLCRTRSDAFVMALLPTAMRGGYDITCHTPMSRRLHYQLEEYLIPSLCAAGDLYHPMAIHAPLSAEPIPNRGAVGTGFSGGVDTMYTIMTHGSDSAYPVSHLALFNAGVFDGPSFRKAFRHSCRNAERFAREMKLELVCLDSNIRQILPERFIEVCGFRNFSCALALQNLFSVYLYSSGYDFAHFSFDLRSCGSYEMLAVSCAQTEALSFYFSGGQSTRVGKLEALVDWEPAHRWLHPCVYGHVGEQNCGHCKKCARDMTTLHALGALDRFGAVFDIPAYRRALPQRIGFVLANRGDYFYDETIALLEKNGTPIPPAAYACEKQFRAALEHLKKQVQ